jgi:hypothetical protein
MTNEFFIDSNNIVRWESSKRVPFTDKLTEFLVKGLVTSEQVVNSIRVREEEEAKTIADYIARRKKTGYTEEEKYELKAAFGNEEVINLFTGLSVYK